MATIDYLKELSGKQLESIVNEEHEHEYVIFGVSIFNAGVVINLEFTNDLPDVESDEFVDEYGYESFVVPVYDCVEEINAEHLFDRFQTVTKIDEQANETLFYYLNDEPPIYNLVTTVLHDYFHLSGIWATDRSRVENSIHEGKAHLIYAVQNANIHYLIRKSA